MKRVVQIYVSDVRLDLFNDENIDYTSKIQDVRDIKMVFSDFTQTFTVPASDTNNKVFKHFYETNITGGYFDARKKVDAEIFINHASFKRGKVFLNGVNMKMKKPSSYEIVFYSNLIKLKDLIGDDELESLSYLSNYDHEYSNTNVSNGLQDGLDLNSQTDSIIYPLITSKKRLFYNSSGSLAFQDNFDGNIYHNSSDPDAYRGLVYTDLKPAIKVLHVIEAIESKYSISFTRDVTGSTNNFFSSTAFSNLYMWLSRNKDNINEYSTGSSEEKFTRTFNDFISPTNTIDNVSYSSGVFSITTDGTSTQNYDITVTNKTVSNADKNYTIKITNVDTGNVVASNRVKGANQSVGFLINNNNIGTTNLKVSITSSVAISVNPEVRVLFNTGTDDDATDVSETYTRLAAASLITNIDILEHIPKMKVIDFLGGLFKMFNLTAFFIDDRSHVDFDKIKVQTLDTFYTSATDNPSGGTIDITDYIDISSHRVDVSLPFNEIELKYQEPKTLLAEEHRERFNKIFGDAEFKLEEVFPDEIDRGTKYEIQLPFEHMKFERLLDLGDADLAATEIQVGYSAKGDFRFEEGIDADNDGDLSDAGDKPSKGNYEPVLTKPLLFYGINKTSITTKINYNSDGVSGTDNLGLTKYFRASNTNEEGSNEASPLETGTTTSTVENKLVDSGQNFTSTLAVGDVVKNTTDNTSTLVKTVDSDTQLSLQSNIFTSGEGYKIFRPPAHTINFDNEVDEYQFIDYNGTTNSLYKKFYKTYVESVFNKAKRIYKYNAYLPASFMIQFRLNDQLKIQDKVYRINSINTNLTTGEASLELLNLTSDEQL